MFNNTTTHIIGFVVCLAFIGYVLGRRRVLEMGFGEWFCLLAGSVLATAFVNGFGF